MKPRCLIVSLAWLALCLGRARAAGIAEPGHWEVTGWGGGGGFFADAWDPGNPNVIYMGGDVSGMLKTDDKGLHWHFINKGISSYGIYSIAISRSSPNILFVLGMGGGMCKTTDGGERWQVLPETTPDKLNITGVSSWTVRAIAIDPIDPQIVYAGSAASGRLYKTQDGGTTWKELDIAHATLAEVPLEKPKLTVPEKKTKGKAKPTARGTAGGKGVVISSVAVAALNPKLILATSSGQGILRSQDGGVTWTQVHAAPEAWSVAIATSNPDIIYACYNNDERMLRSADGGKTWNYINQGVDPAFAPREIAVDPTDPDIIHVIGTVGGTGVIGNSRDGGQTWGEFITHVTRDLTVNPTHPDQLTDGSTGLARLNHGNNICLNPHNPDEIHVAGGGVPALSSDGGKTWQERDRGAEATNTDDIRFLPGGKVYVGCENQGLLMSADNGGHWQQLFPLIPQNQTDGHVWRVWPSHDGQRILATHQPPGLIYPNHVILSEDGGKTFALITDGLPAAQPIGRPTMWDHGAFRGLAVDPQHPAVIYISLDGQPDGGIYKSADAGKTWAALPHQPPSRCSWMGLHLDPTDANRIYYGTCGKDGGLYRSDDAGDSWKLVFKQEPWLWDFGVSPTGIVYCGQQNLYRSTDHGETWEKLTDFKEADRRIAAVEFDPRNPQRFWIASFDPNSAIGDIWRTDNAGKTFADITGDNPIGKTYILRFNPETNELWSGGVGLQKIKQ